MKEFNHYSNCIKCAEDASKPAFIEYKVGIFDSNGQENINIRTHGEPSEGYLMRTCRVCGYKWPEKCIDAKEQS